MFGKTGRFLKDYVVADVNNLESAKETTLRQVAETVKFPLTHEDEEDIKDLLWRFDSERDGISGLSAPQIGVAKRIMVIRIGPDIAKIHECQEFWKTVWINPRYYIRSDETEEKWEQCFSVKGYVGPVKRYKTVFYSGFLQDGSPIRGRADGYAARVIQHEIDHLNGKLFVDHVPREQLLTEAEYMKTFHSPDEWLEKEIDGSTIQPYPRTLADDINFLKQGSRH